MVVAAVGAVVAVVVVVVVSVVVAVVGTACSNNVCGARVTVFEHPRSRSFPTK